MYNIFRREKIRLINVSIFIILTCVAQITIALENQSKDYYTQLNIGYAYGRKSKGDFATSKMSNSILYEVEVGYKVNKNFRTSISLDYMPNFKNNYSTIINYPSEIPLYTLIESYNTRVKSFATMFNVYYDIVNVNNFSPYINIGAGASRNRTSFSTNITNSTGFNQTIHYSDAWKNNFAYKMGIGVRVLFNSNFEFDLRYQYVNLGKFKTNSPSMSNDRTNVKTGTLRSDAILLGVVYKF